MAITRVLAVSVLVAAAAMLAGCMDPFTGSVASSRDPAFRAPPARPSMSVATSVQMLFTDDFNRPDNPDVGNGWIEKSPSVFSLQNNSVIKVQSSDYRDCVVYRPQTEAIRDVQAQDVFTDTATSSYAGYPQVWVRIQSDTVASPNTLDGYVLYLPNSSVVAEMSRQRGTSDVQSLQSFNLTQSLTPGDRYRLLLQAVGANPVQLDAEVDWYNGSSWQTIGSGSYSDSSASQITTSGVAGFGGDTQAGMMAYDSFSYGVPSGLPSPSQWPPSSTTFSDDFNRPDSPDIGNGWTEKNPSVFALKNGTVVKAASSDYRANIVFRPSNEDILDVEDSVEFTDTSTDPNAPGYPQIWVRVQRDTVSTINTLDGYLLYLYDSPNTAYLARQHGTSYVVWLQQITLSQPIQPGGRYRMTLRAQGTDPSVQLSATIGAYTGSGWQTIGSANVADTAPDRITTPGTLGFGGSIYAGLYAYDNFAYGPVGSAPPPGNQPPVADFSYSCAGLSCSFSNRSTDSDGSIAGSSWSFGDDATSTATNPSHTYPAAGSYNVVLTVTDNDGAQSAAYSQSVTVTNPTSGPTVDAGPDEQVVLGAPYDFRASFRDRRSNGPWSYVIDWGDGGSTSDTTRKDGRIRSSHTYLGTARSVTITLTVTDRDGASGADTKVVTLIP